MTDLSEMPLSDKMIVALGKMHVRFFYGEDGETYISRAYWRKANESSRVAVTALVQYFQDQEGHSHGSR